MKKLILVLGFVLLVAGVVFALPSVAQAADLTPLHYQFPAMGTPVDNTFKATLTDSAQSIHTLAATAGITWVQSGQPPNGATISTETYGVRYGTGNITAASTTGHVMAVNTSWRFPAAGYINALYLCNAVAGDNAVVQITLER